VLSTIAVSLSPEGRVKKAVRLICGVCVMLSLLNGIKDFDITAYSRSMAEYRADAEKMLRDSEEEREHLKKEYIEERCEAYILDKAAEAGVELSDVKVVLEWSTEGYWYPVEAEIRGEGDEGARYTLSKTIESELGIPVEKQSWSDTDEYG
jgi:stage III sporulation protein AF